jgi:hypothetical protein
LVEPAWNALSFDLAYYRVLIEKAYGEIIYAFTPGTGKK